jgi:transcriptional regulator with XRE-family HTH domain
VVESRRNGSDGRTGGREASFGQLLRRYRGARGLTQQELAERSGLSVDAISVLERDLRTAPRTVTVEALARALQLDASEREALASAARARRRAPGFEPLGQAPDTTRVLDWTTGRILYSTVGHTIKVSVQPTGAALALGVVRTAPDGPSDVVIVPAAGTGAALHGAVLF